MVFRFLVDDQQKKMEVLELIFDLDREIQKEAEDGIEVDSNSDYSTIALNID